MMRRFLRALFGLALRIFFRRVEVEGVERVPLEGAVIFAVNHPNALVDPLLLLCFAPRPVSVLAKAPLFSMPVIGSFVRAFDSIPVYRSQDPGTDLSRNRETFEAARGLLSRGGSLVLFPEGASHDDSKLRRLKTGAARIALGAAALSGWPIALVPAGLYYTWKQRFRSSALLSFGNPIPVAPAPLEADGEPPADVVRSLTRRLEEELSELTLQAENREALDLVRRAERLFSAGEEEARASLSGELDRRRQLAEGHRRLAERDPAQLEAIEDRIARFEAERKAAGLPLEDLTPARLGAAAVTRLLARNLAGLLLLPFAAVGLLLHYPAYRLAAVLSRRVARSQEDVLATVKIAAAMLFFPATWLAAAALAWRVWGPRPGLAAFLLAPICGWAALVTAERLDQIAGRARAMLHVFSSGYGMKRLIAERRAIREEILRIREELETVRRVP
jgi:glycerol-3-phosphate O-acyltransferase/dihydroxyacetone phosphate acyltransferase